MNAPTIVNDQPQTAASPVPQPSPATDSVGNPGSDEESTRCQHHFANRSRCRLLVSPSNSRFCSRHAKLPENQQPADLTSDLFRDSPNMHELDDIYHYLTNLLYLLSENRISTRRAAVLAYISNQLLRTLTAIERKEAAAVPQIFFGPPRTRPDEPAQDGEPLSASRV